MLDLLQKMIGWGTITRGQDANGFVQVDAGDPKPIEKVIQLGLPGAYAKAAASVKGIVFRLLFGTLFVAADTAPPSDATDWEVGWIIAGATTVLARLLPSRVFEIKGTRSGLLTPGIYLGAADLSDGVPLFVARTTDPVVLDGITVGTVQATTVRVVAA